jgi:hypothetical protein
MSHARQQIREALATVVTGLTSTGSRVYQSRMRAQESLPCLLVVTNNESIAQADFDNQLEHTLSLVITGVAKAAANVDDALDTIAAEVETAIGSLNSLGGKVRGLALESIETDFDDTLEQPVGLVNLGYRCTYFTNAGVPGTTL